MIKLTRLDGMPTWINPAHIVSVTSGNDQDGNTMTCVYTTCTHDKGNVEFVREAPRHVARMIEYAEYHSLGSPDLDEGETGDEQDQETEVRLRPKPDYELDGGDYFEATSMPGEGAYERDDIDAVPTDLDGVDNDDWADQRHRLKN